MSGGALSTLAIATLAGALRVSTPFLFVSLGECLTEKSGRINLGNEGALVLGAMTAYAASYLTGSPWVGVLVAAICGGLLGALHAGLCSLTRINDIAMGIAIMLAGTGIAFFFGKPYVQPSAPLLPTLPLGFWSDSPQIRSALDVSPLFFIGILVGVFMTWAFQNTRAGMVVRTRAVNGGATDEVVYYIKQSAALGEDLRQSDHATNIYRRISMARRLAFSSPF